MPESSGDLGLDFLPRDSFGLAGIQGRRPARNFFLPKGFGVRIRCCIQTIQQRGRKVGALLLREGKRPLQKFERTLGHSESIRLKIKKSQIYVRSLRQSNLSNEPLLPVAPLNAFSFSSMPKIATCCNHNPCKINALIPLQA